MANTLGYIAVQDLTYTQKRHGIEFLVSYLNGGVAGSETVTVTDRHIRVTIASGTSTAAQIKTAVEANYEASLLVTITVTGTGTNAQVSCVSAALSGGHAVTTATLSRGSLLFTAATAGTAGNSVTVVFTPGATAGAEAVSVISNAITIQIADGVSTYAQVKTAYDLVSAATALATVSSNGLSLTSKARVLHCPTATNLAGGTAAAAGAVIIQDLTYAGDVTGTTMNGKTITYTTGATAGAEAVTVVAGGVTVQIENGVSTATQVKAAVDAVPAFDGVAATGSIVVTDYANLHLTKASGTITYGTPLAAAAAVAATPSGVLTFGTPSNDSTVIVTGPTGGPFTFTKKDSAVLTAASVAINDLTYTAVTEGDAGNDITVEYVGDLSGDLAVVEVTGTAILVHMDDTAVTGTTGNTIKTAVNADPEASLLVLVTGTDATVQADQGPTSLFNGFDTYVLGATEFEDITGLTALLTAVTGLDASDDASDITLVVTQTGSGPNSWTITGTSSYSALSITFGSGTDAVSASTVTVNGVTSTKVTAGPGANEFTNITELTALITAITGIDATDNGSVITVVAATAGTAGNSLAMSKTGAGLTLSGALLTGGVAASTVTVAGHVLVESTNFNATSSNDQTATNIASAVNGLSEVNSTATTNTVNIVAAALGTAGNSIAVLTSDAVRLLKSGANLTGGTDAYACTITGTGGTAQKTVNSAVPAGEATPSIKDYYNNQAGTALTTSFVPQYFGFHAATIILKNDETGGSDSVSWSFDGSTVGGVLAPGESVTFDRLGNGIASISLKGVSTPDYHINVVGV